MKTKINNLKKLRGIVLFIMLIPLSIFSQSVTDTREDSVCFSVETASQIMNDLQYMDKIIVQKSDSINNLLMENQTIKSSVLEQNEKIKNKNTGLWIQGGVNLILGTLTLIFSN